MNELKQVRNIAYTDQCDALGLPCSSVRRWRQRDKEGRDVYITPGPKPVEVPDFDALESRIEELKHCRKRSHDSGAIHEAFKDQLSRRVIDQYIAEARAEANRHERQSMERVNWLIPGLVWAMDDTEENNLLISETVNIHSTRDLGSRYTFDPPAGDHLASGAEVAENLRTLFTRYGPPLFLKRDWGSNLNSKLVNDVLSDFFVMPLNSPPYYPQFNGAIEKGQDEIKSTLRKLDIESIDQVPLGARYTACQLNLKPRRCLHGRMPCSIFDERFEVMRQFTKRKRREIYDQIMLRTVELALAAGDNCEVDTLWRLAVKTWLLDHGFITLMRNGKCYPLSNAKTAQN